MPLNKICKIFVFLTSFFVFFLDGARTARWFFQAVRTQSLFSIPSRRRKIKTKNTAYLRELRSSGISNHALLNGMLIFSRPKKRICTLRWARRHPDGYNRQPPKIHVPSMMALFGTAEYSKLLASHPHFDLVLSAIPNGMARFALIASKAEVDR